MLLERTYVLGYNVYLARNYFARNYPIVAGSN